MAFEEGQANDEEVFKSLTARLLDKLSSGGG